MNLDIASLYTHKTRRIARKEPYFIPEDPNTPPAVNDEGGFWHYQESSQNSDMFKHSIVAIFKHPEAASGYIPGLVQIDCNLNTQNYTTDSLIKKYEDGYKDGTYQGLTLKSKEPVNMWGRKVYKVEITGGVSPEPFIQYIFATDKGIFKVHTRADSSTQIVKETTQKIFDNLIFE